jgi:arsenite transporter
MQYLKQTDKFFWLFLLIAIFSGLIFPSFFQAFEGLVVYIIMTIMLLLFLKVDILDVVTHMKSPFTILYICLINLIILPIMVYFLFSSLDLKLQMSLFFLAALPTGVSSAVFTDIMKARTSLNLTIVIVSNLLSIFTIPFLFFIFFQADLNLDYFGLFTNLLKIIFIPFIIAKALKQLLKDSIISNMKSYLNFKIIILLSFMIMICISFQSNMLTSMTRTDIKNIGILFMCFILFQLVGYFSIFWKSKSEKLACSNSCMIMNNILGIVLALAFFDTYILNIIILSLIPWNIMIIAKHWYKRYLP